MSDRPNIAEKRSDLTPVSAVNACWSSIGVRGDASCPELKQFLHCRNCPVYSAAAMHILDRVAPADDLARSTSHFAQPKQVKDLNGQSIVIFRVGSEWLALPTACVNEVANPLPIHTLPHRPIGVVMGLASVRGQLLVCVSLGHLIGIEQAGRTDRKVHRTEHRRFLVLRQGQVRAVFPVDEVHGVHRFHPRELKDVPSTVARAATTYSSAVLSWRGRSVGLLDDGLLFHSLKRSVA
jgi:chemotaxis-related protein WspD